MSGPDRPDHTRRSPEPPEQDPTQLAGAVDGTPTELSSTAWASGADTSTDSPATARALAWSQEDPETPADATPEVAYADAAVYDDAAPREPLSGGAATAAGPARSEGSWYRRPIVLFWLSVILVLIASVGLVVTTRRDAPGPDPAPLDSTPTTAAPHRPGDDPRPESVDPPAEATPVPGQPIAPADSGAENQDAEDAAPPTESTPATSERPTTSTTSATPTPSTTATTTTQPKTSSPTEKPTTAQPTTGSTSKAGGQSATSATSAPSGTSKPPPEATAEQNTPSEVTEPTAAPAESGEAQ